MKICNPLLCNEVGSLSDDPRVAGENFGGSLLRRILLKPRHLMRDGEAIRRAESPPFFKVFLESEAHASGPIGQKKNPIDDNGGIRPRSGTSERCHDLPHYTPVENEKLSSLKPTESLPRPSYIAPHRAHRLLLIFFYRTWKLLLQKVH